jgi:hypothetical protein
MAGDEAMKKLLDTVYEWPRFRSKRQEAIYADFVCLYEQDQWQELHQQPRQYSWGWVYTSDGISVSSPTKVGARRKWKNAMKKQQAFLRVQAEVNASAIEAAGPWLLSSTFRSEPVSNV